MQLKKLISVATCVLFATAGFAQASSFSEALEVGYEVKASFADADGVVLILQRDNDVLVCEAESLNYRFGRSISVGICNRAQSE